MYLDDLNSGLIVLDEDDGFLSVGNLPTAVSASFLTSMFLYEILDYTEDFMSVHVYIPCAAFENNSDYIELPIVVLPMRHKTTILCVLRHKTKAICPLWHKTTRFP